MGIIEKSTIPAAQAQYQGMAQSRNWRQRLRESAADLQMRQEQAAREKQEFELQQAGEQFNYYDKLASDANARMSMTDDDVARLLGARQEAAARSGIAAAPDPDPIPKAISQDLILLRTDPSWRRIAPLERYRHMVTKYGRHLHKLRVGILDKLALQAPAQPQAQGIPSKQGQDQMQGNVDVEAQAAGRQPVARPTQPQPLPMSEEERIANEMFGKDYEPEGPVEEQVKQAWSTANSIKEDWPVALVAGALDRLAKLNEIPAPAAGFDERGHGKWTPQEFASVLGRKDTAAKNISAAITNARQDGMDAATIAAWAIPTLRTLGDNRTDEEITKSIESIPSIAPDKQAALDLRRDWQDYRKQEDAADDFTAKVKARIGRMNMLDRMIASANYPIPAEITKDYAALKSDPAIKAFLGTGGVQVQPGGISPASPFKPGQFPQFGTTSKMRAQAQKDVRAALRAQGKGGGGRGGSAGKAGGVDKPDVIATKNALYADEKKSATTLDFSGVAIAFGPKRIREFLENERYFKAPKSLELTPAGIRRRNEINESEAKAHPSYGTHKQRRKTAKPTSKAKKGKVVKSLLADLEKR